MGSLPFPSKTGQASIGPPPLPSSKGKASMGPPSLSSSTGYAPPSSTGQASDSTRQTYSVIWKHYFNSTRENTSQRFFDLAARLRQDALSYGYGLTAFQQKRTSQQNELISHGKLFVFAEYWAVHKLRALCLRNLSDLLQELVLTAGDMGHFLEFAEWCFETPRAPILQLLVMSYCGLQVEILYEHERFQNLISRNPVVWESFLGPVVKVGTMVKEGPTVN
ncbi:hypothetical protein B0H66DRAFT_166468 [Apodospora peruviana]|uniref:Uncharacterized protein n=1 Tax=Apodospora peruviana TaxID=516989 RepID=A0AAE0IKI7_9PEZI|nr:hypothetical protein B0H66DRAFT_166468 [Apodospora peruviana]